MKKHAGIIALSIFAIALVTYSAGWFHGASRIEKEIQLVQKEHPGLSFETLTITGFPFLTYHLDIQDVSYTPPHGMTILSTSHVTGTLSILNANLTLVAPNPVTISSHGKKVKALLSPSMLENTMQLKPRTNVQIEWKKDIVGLLEGEKPSPTHFLFTSPGYTINYPLEKEALTTSGGEISLSIVKQDDGYHAVKLHALDMQNDTLFKQYNIAPTGITNIKAYFHRLETDEQTHIVIHKGTFTSKTVTISAEGQILQQKKEEASRKSLSPPELHIKIQNYPWVRDFITLASRNKFSKDMIEKMVGKIKGPEAGSDSAKNLDFTIKPHPKQKEAFMIGNLNSQELVMNIVYALLSPAAKEYMKNNTPPKRP